MKRTKLLTIVIALPILLSACGSRSTPTGNGDATPTAQVTMTNGVSPSQGATPSPNTTETPTGTEKPSASASAGESSASNTNEPPTIVNMNFGEYGGNSGSMTARGQCPFFFEEGITFFDIGCIFGSVSPTQSIYKIDEDFESALLLDVDDIPAYAVTTAYTNDASFTLYGFVGYYRYEDFLFERRNAQILLSAYPPDDSGEVVIKSFQNESDDFAIIFIDAEWVYYSYSKYTGYFESPSLHRIKFDGSEDQTIVGAEANAGYFNIIGEYVYYISNDTDFNSLCRIRIDGTGEEEFIFPSHFFHALNASGEYLYFSLNENSDLVIAKMKISDVVPGLSAEMLSGKIQRVTVGSSQNANYGDAFGNRFYICNDKIIYNVGQVSSSSSGYNLRIINTVLTNITDFGLLFSSNNEKQMGR